MFEWLPERIEQAKIISDEFEQGWKFLLNPPATEAEIRACEMGLGVPLLPSYREFLLRWNGAHLFYTNESLLPDGDIWRHGGPMFSIQGAHELIAFNQENRLDFTDKEWNSLILFCSYVGGGDSCGLDPQQTTNLEYTVIDCFHELEPAEWQQARIATFFAEWLERLFDCVDERKHPAY